MNLKEHTREPFRQLWGDGRGPILLLVASGWFLSLGARLIFPAVLPFIRADYGLSLSVSGLLISVLWLAYGLGQFPGGLLADRIGEGNILTISTLCSAAAMVVVALSINVESLFVATVLFGVSTALYGPTRITIISSIYAKRDGMALGLTLAAGNLGNAILPVLAGVIAAAYVWQLGFGVLVPLFVLVSAGIRVTIPARLSDRPPRLDMLSVGYLRTLLSAIRTPAITVVTAVQVIGAFIIQSFTGFFPTYLITVKEISPQVVAGIFGLFFALAIVVQPFTGYCADRLGTRPTLISVFAMMAVGLAALPMVESLWVVIGLTCVLSSINGFGPVTLTFLANRLPPEVRGSGLGLVRSGYFTLAASGPVLIGVFADFGFFDEAFLVLGALAGVAVLLIFLLPRE